MRIMNESKDWKDCSSDTLNSVSRDRKSVLFSFRVETRLISNLLDTFQFFVEIKYSMFDHLAISISRVCIYSLEICICIHDCFM